MPYLKRKWLTKILNKIEKTCHRCLSFFYIREKKSTCKSVWQTKYNIVLNCTSFKRIEIEQYKLLAECVLPKRMLD